AFQSRTQLDVCVRVRGTVRAAVLVDGKGALDAASGAAKRLLHGVANDALGDARFEPREALGRAVIDGENEPEIDGVPETPPVLDEGPPDGRLVSSERAVARTDSVEL